MRSSTTVIAELTTSFETESFAVFLRLLNRRLQHLAVGMVDGKVVARADAEAMTAQVVQLMRVVCGRLEERPVDALRVLDTLRGVGVAALEPLRASHEAACARRYPAPPPPSWRVLGELRARAERHPEHCQLGPPVAHVAFAARLADEGTEVPAELLALYAVFGHVTLRCRHVPVTAGSICAGDALRVRDGRLHVLPRAPRQPVTLHVEQPGISVAQLLGTAWFVLEDERAPATRRPLDVPGFLGFALHRMEATTLEALLTDLSWRRFFA
jgi:hypothetical protein